MRPEEPIARVRGMRLLLAAVLVLSALAGAQQASARPTHADLEAAKARLSALNQQMDALVVSTQLQFAAGAADLHAFERLATR